MALVQCVVQAESEGPFQQILAEDEDCQLHDQTLILICTVSALLHERMRLIYSTGLSFPTSTTLSPATVCQSKGSHKNVSVSLQSVDFTWVKACLHDSINRTGPGTRTCYKKRILEGSSQSLLSYQFGVEAQIPH